jgi:hypothetical protein
VTKLLHIPTFAELSIGQFNQFTAAARKIPTKKKPKTATGVAELEREVRVLSTRADEIAAQIRTLQVEASILAAQRTVVLAKRHKLQREISNIKARNEHGQ